MEVRACWRACPQGFVPRKEGWMKVIFRVLFLSLVVVCVAGAAEAQEGDLQQDWCAFGPEYCGGGGGGGDPESIA